MKLKHGQVHRSDLLYPVLYTSFAPRQRYANQPLAKKWSTSRSGREQHPHLRMPDEVCCMEKVRMWNKMYQNPTFNQGRRVTEEEVMLSMLSLPSPYHPCFPPAKAYVDWPQNIKCTFATDNKNIYTANRQFECTGLNLPKKFSKRPVPPVSPPPPRLQWKEDDIKAPTPPVCLPPSRRLWRRPPVHPKLPSIPDTTALPPDAFSDEAISRLEQWQTFRLTTVYRDDPMDPNSFYNRFFPLCLKAIPIRRRSPDMTQAESIEDLSKVQPERDVSFTFFDNLPFGRLSSPEMTPIASDEEDEKEQLKKH